MGVFIGQLLPVYQRQRGTVTAHYHGLSSKRPLLVINTTSAEHIRNDITPGSPSRLTFYKQPHATATPQTAFGKKPFKPFSSSSLKPVEVHFTNSPTNKPRLALCIAGNTRTFHYRMVHERILENVLLPLRKVATVDVFFVVKLDDDPRPLFPRSPASVASTRLAMSKFNPVSIRELTPYDDILRSMDRSRFKPVYEKKKQANSGAVLKQRLLSKPVAANCTAHPGARAFVPYALHRTRQCLSEIRTYEASLRGLKYKYLYRIRPDVVFLDVIPMPTLLTPGTVVTNAVQALNTQTVVQWWYHKSNATAPDTGDHFLAALADDADIAFSAVDAVHDCELFKISILRNPESVMLYWFLTKNLTPVTPQAAWVLVRENVGPECIRLKLLRVENSLLRDAMVKRCERFRKEFQWSTTEST